MPPLEYEHPVGVLCANPLTGVLWTIQSMKRKQKFKHSDLKIILTMVLNQTLVYTLQRLAGVIRILQTLTHQLHLDASFFAHPHLVF